MILNSLSQEITMPNGKVATVVAYRAKYMYAAEIRFSNGNSLPCSFSVHKPMCLADALGLAISFVRRVNAKSILA